jgi:hypothetical protein
LTADDLYRLGNATSARLDHVRVPKDIPTIDKNGIAYVLPGGFGISVFNETGIKRQYGDGWVWKIKKGSQISPRLRLVNDRGDHYLITPAFEMPLDEFRGLLSPLAATAERVQKLSALRI